MHCVFTLLWSVVNVWDRLCAGTRDQRVLFVIIVFLMQSIIKVSIKRFLKEIPGPHVGMTNALAAKYSNKECYTCSDMHSIYNMTTLFNNYPYISSSKFNQTNVPPLIRKGWLQLCSWPNALLCYKIIYP